MKNTVFTIKNLAIGYNDKRIIENINTEIHQGEIVGIIGPNGAGKSTFLKTLRGIMPALEGEILLDDKAITDYAERDFAKRVAYLQQHVEVGFGYTAKEIVLAGRYPYKKWWENENAEDEKLAMDCLAYTGTANLADKAMGEVSGGQKQRILLAKVLAQQTPILFLDEPTTGLDIVYQEEIFRFAKALAEMGKTVLMVVHELHLAAKFCDRLLLLGKGRLLADAPPEQVLTETLLTNAYEVPIKVIRHESSNSWEITTYENNQEKAEDLLAKICQPLT